MDRNLGDELDAAIQEFARRRGLTYSDALKMAARGEVLPEDLKPSADDLRLMKEHDLGLKQLARARVLAQAKGLCMDDACELVSRDAPKKPERPQPREFGADIFRATR